MAEQPVPPLVGRPRVSRRTGKPLPTSALLWDLDNVNVPRRDLAAAAGAMKQACPPDARLYVAGRSDLITACRRTLREAGFTTLRAGMNPQGADKRLCGTGRQLKVEGVCHFYVASDDRDFIRLARRGLITVITRNPAYVSRDLCRVLHGMLVLQRDGEDTFTVTPVPILGHGHDVSVAALSGDGSLPGASPHEASPVAPVGSRERSTRPPNAEDA